MLAKYRQATVWFKSDIGPSVRIDGIDVNGKCLTPDNNVVT